ncbi:hypothetical protein ACFQ69_33750 [Streptomyces sp. NPDC056470]|uniref:hypothetical protein n=1 Tax=Streptomyces sp. NPDC056470 TaxID=3345831 RepID=UPI00367E6CF1
MESGAIVNKLIIVVATKPLTGPAGDGAGVPDGYIARSNGCEEPVGLVGVYVCNAHDFPDVAVPKTAEDTTFYWGFAYVPTGGDIAAGIEVARTAGARPADAKNGTGKVIIKSAAHAALNTTGFDTPDVPAGSTVRQQVHIHANDAGELTLSFRIAEGQLWSWPDTTTRLGNVTSTPGASCGYPSDHLVIDGLNLTCRLKPGDHTITYELTGTQGQKALGLQTWSRYDIYDYATYDSDVQNQSKPFTLIGAPALPWHGLLARDTSGALFSYSGTKKAAAPFSQRSQVGTGWQTYNTITSLSPFTQGLYYRSDTKPSAATRGRGDLVARDASGTLWYYDRQFVYSKPYAARVKVGTGWNIYNQITGAGDVNRDGFMDLLARDKAGVLWQYQGTGTLTSSARFKTRTNIGGGWGIYNQLAGGRT